MKKLSSIILAVSLMVSLFSFSANAETQQFTHLEQTVFELTNVTYAEWDSELLEGCIECEAGAEIRTLCKSNGIVVRYTPLENDSGEIWVEDCDYILPVGYTDKDVTESGWLVENVPVGTTYRLNKPGAYIVDIEHFLPGGEESVIASFFITALPAETFNIESKTQDVKFVNGIKKMEAYNIEGNNYFKLRDLCYSLSAAGFYVDVTWDGAKNAINLVTGTPYKAVGGEMVVSDNTVKSGIYSDVNIFINGNPVSLKAYNIGGNNFFKLRDLCQALNVAVDWDESSLTIAIDHTRKYQ